MWELFNLPSGHTLTATVVDGVGFVRRVDNDAIGGRVTNAGPLVVGPFLSEHTFKASSGVTIVIAESSALDVVTSIPAIDQEDSSTVWNDEGVLKVSSAGA